MESGLPPAAPSCSISTKKKFDRALAILGLQPSLHHSQQSLLIVEEDRTEWPKPVFLTRGSKGCNFGVWDEQERNSCYQSITNHKAKLVTESIWNIVGPEGLDPGGIYSAGEIAFFKAKDLIKVSIDA